MRRTLHLTLSAASSIAAISIGMAAPANAEGTPAPDTNAEASASSDQAQPVGLEEIVVTAQKRSENLQRTPIAITAVTSADIARRGVTDISGVANFTPNITFNTTAPISGVSSGAVVFIRGIGQTDFSLTTEPGVGTYVDGVYNSRSVGGVLDVLDLERIEILRGPQGTLFGRNTIGGAISLISKRPSDTFGGELSATGGDFSRFDLRGSVTVPLSESVRTRLVVSSKNRDGFVRGLIDNRRLGNENRDSARLVVEADLSSALTATFSIDGTRIRENNAADKLVGINVTPPGSATRTEYVYNQRSGLVETRTVANSPGNPSLTFLYNVFDAPTTSIPGFGNAPYDGRWITSDIDTTFANGPNGTSLNIWGTSLTLDWDVGDVKFKSISAYRRTDGSFNRDADGSPLALTHTENYDYGQSQFSQELQANFDLLDGRLKTVAGLYYFHEKGRDFLDVTLPASFAFLETGFRIKNDSYAGYVQSSFEIVPDLRLTGGIRYTRDDKSYNAVINTFTLGPVGAAVFGGVPGGSVPLIPFGVVQQRFTNWAPKVALDYQLTPDLLTYASFSKGFKSGGSNIRYLVPRNEVANFDPEKVDSFEFGMKWEGLDRRVRLNASAFNTNYKDIQLIVYEQGAPLIQNAGRARIRGFEFEATALPIPNLQFQASMGYLDAGYRSVNPPANNVPLDQQITIDTKLPKTPKWSLSASVEYTMTLENGGEPFIRGDWSYASQMENDAVNSPFLTAPARSIFNSAIGYRAPAGNWELTAFVQNLTDKRIITSGDSNYGIGFHEANFNRPREWGVTTKFTF